MFPRYREGSVALFRFNGPQHRWGHLTLVCAPIFARFGAHRFWALAARCAVALPLVQTLREPLAGSR
jgi:hypothetical protein